MSNVCDTPALAAHRVVPQWLTLRTAALVVAGFSVLLYLPSLANGFAYDDVIVIQADSRIHDPLNVLQIFSQTYWANPDLGLYRPLASWSYAIDWAISGGDPQWFHLVNVLWNAAAATLLLLFLRSMLPLAAALAGTLIFVAHPVHVEAVANVVGRAEVMAATFMLGALLIWTRSDPQRPLRTGSAAAVAVLYVLALLSKENAIVMPALLGLTDMARGAVSPRTLPAWFRRHAAALVLLTCVALLYLAVRIRITGGVAPSTVDPTLDLVTTAGERILTALQAWPHILRVLLFPRTLLSDYGPAIILPAHSLTPEAVAGLLILGLLVIGGLAAWSLGSGTAAAVLLLLPVSLLPTSNLVVPIGIVMAERTLYLPSIALAWGAGLVLHHLATKHRAIRPLGVLFVLVLALFSLRTITRIPDWRSTDSIFAALRSDRPDSFRAQWYFARVAADSGNPHLALRLYADMLTTWPYRRPMVFEAAGYAAETGDLRFAEQVTAWGLQRWPEDLDFLRLRAGVLLDLGDTTAAGVLIDRALAEHPIDSLLIEMQKAARGVARPDTGSP